MVVHHETVRLDTSPGVQAIDITRQVVEAVRASGVHDGLACVFSPSSTSAVIANEFEPGLMEEDVPGALERLLPQALPYGHERRWHDGNGHSHVRASLLGQGFTFPFHGGKPLLGTWQQLWFLELDNKARTREVRVTLVG